MIRDSGIPHFGKHYETVLYVKKPTHLGYKFHHWEPPIAAEATPCAQSFPCWHHLRPRAVSH